MSNFTATCHAHPDLFTTDDAHELEAHLTADGRKPKAWHDRGWTGPTPQWVRSADKPWKFRLSSKPFTPKPFEPGDYVCWVDGDGNLTVRCGQVWSGHPYAKTRWVVADSKAYAVHERELAGAWLANARERIARGGGVGNLAAPDYWTEAVATVERQLDEIRQAAATAATKAA